jgi:hypothetical protein
MCRNCFQVEHYQKAENKAKIGSNADQAPPPDKATMREWFVEAGHNAREAARRHLPAGATFHTLAKRILAALADRSHGHAGVSHEFQQK